MLSYGTVLYCMFVKAHCIRAIMYVVYSMVGLFLKPVVSAFKSSKVVCSPRRRRDLLMSYSHDHP